jgi:hypothetical protein
MLCLTNKYPICDCEVGLITIMGNLFSYLFKKYHMITMLMTIIAMMATILGSICILGSIWILG